MVQNEPCDFAGYAPSGPVLTIDLTFLSARIHGIGSILLGMVLAVGIADIGFCLISGHRIGDEALKPPAPHPPS